MDGGVRSEGERDRRLFTPPPVVGRSGRAVPTASLLRPPHEELLDDDFRERRSVRMVRGPESREARDAATRDAVRTRAAAQ